MGKERVPEVRRGENWLVCKLNEKKVSTITKLTAFEL